MIFVPGTGFNFIVARSTPTSPTATNTYGYNNANWGDQLTSFNGNTITYDAIGNPLSYNNGTLYTYNFTWENGRRLASATYGSNTITYTYNDEGVRTGKNVNGTEHIYYLDGSRIIAETMGSSLLVYLYDADGSPIGMQYRSRSMAEGEFYTYWYEKNLQGDIVAVYNDSGVKIFSYSYDAWGNVTTNRHNTSGSNALARHNPFLYRGYYRDSETGFYYLNSRYYDPEVGRWVNADSVISGVGGSIQGHNVFSYCFNNPVNMNDQTGNWPKWIKNPIKWVAKNIVKPVVKTVQHTLSNVDITYSRGVNISGTPSIFIFNLQAGISIDTDGNIAIQGSAGGGITSGSPSISVTEYKSVTNAPSIEKLEDLGYQIGGSVGIPVSGVPLAAGLDFNIVPDNDLNTAYCGITTNGGFGVPGGEFHVEWGKTGTLGISKSNIFDTAEYIYNKIMEW